MSVLIRFIFDENVDGFFTKTFFVKVLKCYVLAGEQDIVIGIVFSIFVLTVTTPEVELIVASLFGAIEQLEKSS